MEFSQLEFFVTVVEEGSFSKAAERVYRTQPAVSIAIRRLEDEIGAPLFERSQKTQALTEVGKLVYDYAKRILSLRDQTIDVVSELRSLKRGRVRIGANESTSLYLLPHLILDYRALYPNIMVEIFRHASERLPREVLDRNVNPSPLKTLVTNRSWRITSRPARATKSWRLSPNTIRRSISPSSWQQLKPSNVSSN